MTLGGDAQNGALNRAQRAAVRDDQDLLVGVVVSDSPDRVDDAQAVVRVRLAVVAALPVSEARPALGVALLDLVRGEPFPRADVDLTERRLDLDHEVVRLRDDLGRLPRAAEIARIHGGERPVGELLGEAPPPVGAPRR